MPAAAIAGDTFDFSLARDVLHLSLTDAMGHGVAAALTATLCVGGLRNARNSGASLLEQVASTNQALAGHAAQTGGEDFVTGLVGRDDLRTGAMELVNSGHVAPCLALRVRWWRCCCASTSPVCDQSSWRSTSTSRGIAMSSERKSDGK